MTLESQPISRFFLLGEPARPAGERFVHLEFLDERSRPANWTIAPHAHQDLHHIFLVESGGGEIDADGRRIKFAAPCYVVAPAGVVHGFRWVAESIGRVLTFSDAFMRAIALREPALAGLFESGAWVASFEPDAADAMTRLARELAWAAVGHDLIIEAHLSAIMVGVLRSRRFIEQELQAPPSREAYLVARYREWLESRYISHPSVEESALALGVTSARLRAACRATAGVSPHRMLQDRLRLEAERVMSYSNMNISQVARYLGFDDPAYFTRFFARMTGISPAAYRRASRRDGARAR